MRTISALIAATFCALALSVSAFAGDRDQSRVQAFAPGWLEFRTAFAAEDLWPEKMFTTKSGRAQSPVRQPKDVYWPEALQDTAAVAFRQGLDVLRNWGRAAEQVLTNERASFDVAGN